ncbi:T9SS type A sorting domain-containing protein [Antarcticibacterium flavum]|uniref:T9SS type A sorting domain-containing protein n=1 Tax=Antarcticibacterium flavum TaxID=2058175 RepID=A0A5B7X781_9FLAO|nr:MULTISPECIES: T9SS type A sorting domain-containing protein [Antarcticibacterium]MCM4160323.1 hypothetical protein [Antarcticibacterium sp. W02-3]QCY71297.1 T9SS type A sorting domain-containing protein [Antarcticibacterium flavum]
MKNVIKISLLALMLVSGSVKAADELDVKVSQKKAITIELNNLSSSSVLLFQDKDGNILFRDSLELNGHYKKTLDLEVIPNGVYSISLEGERSVMSKQVVKTHAGLELTNAPAGILFKPCFEVKEKQVTVFLTNPGKKTIYFDVYDAQGIKVSTLTRREAVIQKRLDFSQVPSGTYTIKVRVGGRIFIEEFDLG